MKAIITQVLGNGQYKVKVWNNKPLRDKLLSETRERRDSIYRQAENLEERLNELEFSSKLRKLKDDIQEAAAKLRFWRQEVKWDEKYHALIEQKSSEIIDLEDRYAQTILEESEFKRAVREMWTQYYMANADYNRYLNSKAYFEYIAWAGVYGTDYQIDDEVNVEINNRDINSETVVIIPDYVTPYTDKLISKELMTGYEYLWADLHNLAYAEHKPHFCKGVVTRVNDPNGKYLDVEIKGGLAAPYGKTIHKDCFAKYNDLEKTPYTAGDEVLVWVKDKVDSDVLCFWQQPRRAFEVSLTSGSYHRGIIVNDMPDIENEAYDKENNYGNVNTVNRTVPLFTVLSVKSPLETEYKDVFVGLQIGRSEPDQYKNTTGLYYNFAYKNGKSYNSAIFINGQNSNSSPATDYDGDTNVINDGQLTNKKIVLKRSGSGTTYPFIVFKSFQVGWNNCIIDINETHATIRNGYQFIPPSFEVRLYREDQSYSDLPFDNAEVQSYMQRFINNRQALIDNTDPANIDLNKVLFNPRSGITHTNYNDFINDCLTSSGLYSQNIVDEYYADSKIKISQIPKVFELDNTASITETYATTLYSSSTAPNLDTYNPTECERLINESLHFNKEVIQWSIIESNKALGQTEDWYVNSVSDITDIEYFKNFQYTKNFRDELDFSYNTVQYEPIE